MPTEIIEKALTRLTEFRFYRIEIMKDVKEIQALIGRLKQKITGKVLSDNKWTGMLAGKKDNYFKCISIDERSLDAMLEQDLNYWLLNLEKTKNESAQK